MFYENAIFYEYQKTHLTETKCLRIVYAEFGGKQAVLYSSLSLAHNVKAIRLKKDILILDKCIFYTITTLEKCNKIH